MVGDGECPYQLSELKQQTASPSAAPCHYLTRAPHWVSSAYPSGVGAPPSPTLHRETRQLFTCRTVLRSVLIVWWEDNHSLYEIKVVTFSRELDGADWEALATLTIYFLMWHNLVFPRHNLPPAYQMCTRLTSHVRHELCGCLNKRWCSCLLGILCTLSLIGFTPSKHACVPLTFFAFTWRCISSGAKFAI